RMAGLPAEQPPVDPEVAGLLLRQRGIVIARPHRLDEAMAVHAAQVVPLAAAAVIRQRPPAVRVADRRELPGDLPDRRLPRDPLERAVRPPAQRRVEAVGVVLVIVETRRLLAEITLGARMPFIAADPRDPLAVELDLDAAIERAEDARRGMPILLDGSGAHGHLLRDKASSG